MASYVENNPTESSVPSAIDKPSISPIAQVAKRNHSAAASTLAEAFVHDEVARYLVDIPEREHWAESQKYDLHFKIMDYLTYAHCVGGLTTAIGPSSDPYGSVALWMTPNASIESFRVFFSSGLWRLSYKLGLTGFKRFFVEFLPLLEHTKAEVLGKDRAEDCYYLVYLGTKPSCRGLGLAKRLVEDMSKKADQEGKCCYLESSNVRNLKLYKRLGFEVKKQIVLGGAGRNSKEIPLDIMVRQPGGLLSMEAVDSGVSMGQASSSSEGSEAMWK